jgi:hypothetical protein
MALCACGCEREVRKGLKFLKGHAGRGNGGKCRRVLANGYGITVVGNKKVYAHRWVYEQKVGPIPQGLTLDHKFQKQGCPPRCVNPDHLEPVTMQVNAQRGRRNHLSPESVTIIKEFSHLPAKLLAALFGVRVSNIRNVRSGLTWNNITLEVLNGI